MDFTTRIKDRITQYDFTEGQDFVTSEILSSPVSGSSKSRPQKITEYHITLEMAKELSMVEHNDQGNRARKYFIECERMLKEVVVQAPQVTAPANLVEALEMALAQQRRLVTQQHMLNCAEELIVEKVEEIERLEGVIEEKDEIIKHQEPKVIAWDKYLDSDSLVGFEDFAAGMVNMSGLSMANSCL